jgi:hypothetical protein
LPTHHRIERAGQEQLSTINQINMIRISLACRGLISGMPIWNSILEFEMKLVGYLQEVIPGWSALSCRVAA